MIFFFLDILHLSNGGHIDSFQVLTIMNKAAINIHVQVFAGLKFSSMKKISKVYGKSVFCFLRNH
jgi:hypothetical protein